MLAGIRADRGSLVTSRLRQTSTPNPDQYLEPLRQAAGGCPVAPSWARTRVGCAPLTSSTGVARHQPGGVIAAGELARCVRRPLFAAARTPLTRPPLRPFPTPAPRRAQCSSRFRAWGVEDRPLFAPPQQAAIPVFKPVLGSGGQIPLESTKPVRSFANDDPSVFRGGRFEEDQAGLTLVVPAGIGSELRLHGQIAGSPLEDGIGHVRVKSSLAVLPRNRWFEVEQTVGEIKIRLGERARKLDEPTN